MRFVERPPSAVVSTARASWLRVSSAPAERASTSDSAKSELTSHIYVC